MPFASRYIGNNAAYFLHQKTACGRVPGLELQFPETVESSGSKISKVQGRRSRGQDN